MGRDGSPRTEGRDEEDDPRVGPGDARAAVLDRGAEPARAAPRPARPRLLRLPQLRALERRRRRPPSSSTRRRASSWRARTPRPPAAPATRRWCSTTWGPPAPTATRTRTAASSARSATPATCPRAGPTRRRCSRRTTARGCPSSRPTRGSTARPATATSGPTSTRTRPPSAATATSRPTSRPRIPATSRAGFSRKCEDCHSVTAAAWSTSVFSHPATFPLSGAHAGVTCARCHGAGRPHAIGSACVVVPRGRLRGGGQPEPHGGRLPAHVRGLSHERVVAAGEVRPLGDPLPADGAAHRRPVRHLPRGRALHGDAARLQLLPPAGLRAHHQPEPRGGALLDAVPGLPQHQRLAAGQLRPPEDPFRAHGGSRAHAVRELPPGRALHGHAERLQLVSPTGLRAHHQPEPPGRRLPDHVPDLPQHEGLAAGQRRPQPHALPAHRRACAHGLRALPHRRALHGHAHRLQLLPSARLRAHHQPEPRGRRLLDRVPDLPRHERLAAGQRRPQPHALPAHRRARARRTARAATRAGATRARPPTATPATSPTTRAPPTRTTRPEASRPRARAATAPRPGVRPPSTTAAPASRSRAPTHA